MIGFGINRTVTLPNGVFAVHGAGSAFCLYINRLLLFVGLPVRDAVPVSRPPTLKPLNTKDHYTIAIWHRFPRFPCLVKVVLPPLHIVDGVATNAVGRHIWLEGSDYNRIESAQVPLDNFHLNVICTGCQRCNSSSGLVGVVMVPLPLSMLHKPVPTMGVLPAIVAWAQTV
jgi:hypothetical protein